MKKQNKKKKVIKGRKQGNGKGKSLILSSIVLVPVFCLLAVYAAGVSHYRNRFLSGTVIDQVDVSGMTIPEVEEQIGKYSLRVIERQADGPTLEEEISGSDIGISYGSTVPLQNIIQGQNRFLWFLKQDTVYETEAVYSYEEAALVERVGELRGFQEEFIKESDGCIHSGLCSGKRI